MQKTKRIVQDIPVIEIESSPEPVPVPRSRPIRRTRSSSKAPSASAQTYSKGKGKEREKASSQIIPSRKPSKINLGPVIELTDSDSESGPVVGPSRTLKIPHKIMRANSHSNTLQSKPIGASASLDNIPMAYDSGSSSKRKCPNPLFLPSDEENEPPFVVVEEQVEHEPTSKKPRPDKGKGKGKEREILTVDMDLNDNEEDWDPEFAKKPFPFQYLDDDPLKVVLARMPAPAPAPAPAVLAPQPEPVPAPIAQLAPVAQLPPPPEPEPVAQPAAPVQPPQVAIPASVPPAAAPIPVAKPIPEPEPEVDPASRAVAQVLEIIPDVEPEYLLGLVQGHLPNFGQQTAEHVLGQLFEDGGYPRVDLKKKGKRKSDAALDNDGEGERPNKKAKVDYTSVDREFIARLDYTELALVQLQTSFPFVPKPYLRQSLLRHRGFYAPTYLTLAAAEKTYVEGPLNNRPGRPYVLKSTRYNPAKDRRRMKDVVNEAFADERRWLVEHLQDPSETDAMTVGAATAEPEGKGKGKEKAANEDESLEEGTGIECQCCFAEYAFDKMVQCAEAHLFCRDCVSQYASTKLGEHNHLINCMHECGCKEPFPVSELRRVLSPKLMDLYERVKQQKEIEAAGLEGLEECPFCEWKCVLEVSNEEERLFRCGNEEGGCGVVSCRMCKKKEHLPKTCEEAEADKHLDGRHAIEEAMTRALMRNCPKCKKAFVKDQGCNKMTCPNCRTLSCYVCRQVIKGYDHFDQTPVGRASASKAGGKCLLWDQVEERHAAEVKAAAEKAMAEYKRDHPDAEDKDIKVDLPVAPQPQPAAQLGLPPIHAVIPAAHWMYQAPPMPAPGFFGGFNFGVNHYHHVVQNGQVAHHHHPPMLAPPPPLVQPAAPRLTRAQQQAAVVRAREDERRLQQQQQQQLQHQQQQQQLQLQWQQRQQAQLRHQQERRAENQRANARYQEMLAAQVEAHRAQRDLRARARQLQQDGRLGYEPPKRDNAVIPPIGLPQLPVPAAGRRKRARR